MREKMDELRKPINISDVELRIGVSVYNDYTKGFSLLAYKTSRVDTERFNDVFDSKWYPEYDYDEKGILKCNICVYDTDIKEWICREDVGTESNTEKEKGQYSDALRS